MVNLNWRPPSLSELTPMIFNMGLAHLGSQVFNYNVICKSNFNFLGMIWRPLRPSELSQIIPNMKLTHLGLKASISFSLTNYLKLIKPFEFWYEKTNKKWRNNAKIIKWNIYIQIISSQLNILQAHPLTSDVEC